jgi:hypothetical protein
MTPNEVTKTLTIPIPLFILILIIFEKIQLNGKEMYDLNNKE